MTYKIAGSIRFNTNSSKLEIYNGEQWWEIDATSPEHQTGGTRGVFAAGNNSGNPGGTDIIDYVQFASEGDAIDFGDILNNRQRGPGLTNGHGGL